MIYYIVLAFLLIPVLLYDILEHKRGMKLWYFTELVVLILLVGLRYRVGGDTLDYIELFDDYPFFSELFHFDFSSYDYNPLWYVLNAIIKSTWNDFVFFQLVHSIFVNIVFFWFFKKHTKYIFSAILLYYIVYYVYFNMEILREILSVCVFMLSLNLLIKKNYIKYFFATLIAIGFHSSAIIMFIIPVFWFLPKIKLKFTLFTFIILFIALSFFDIIPILLSFFKVNSSIASRIEIYSSIVGHTLNVNGIIAYLLPIIFLMYLNRKNVDDIIVNKIQNLLFLYTILICLSVFYAAMFSRMQNYLEPLYIIFILNVTIPIIKSQFHKYSLSGYMAKITIIWFLSIAIKSYYIDTSEYMLGTKSYNIYYPYHSVFNPQIDSQREKFVEMYKDSDYDL